MEKRKISERSSFDEKEKFIMTEENVTKSTDLAAEWETFEKLIEGPVPPPSALAGDTTAVHHRAVPAPVPAVGCTKPGIVLSEAMSFSSDVAKGSFVPISRADGSSADKPVKSKTEKQSTKDSSESESESEKSDSDDSSDSSDESATSSDHSSPENKKKGKEKDSSEDESDDSDSDEDEKESTTESSSSSEEEPIEVKPASRRKSDSSSKDKNASAASHKSVATRSKRRSKSPAPRSRRRSSSPPARRHESSSHHHHHSKHSHSSRHKHRRNSSHRSHRSRSRDKRRRRKSRSRSRTRTRRKRSRSGGRRRKHSRRSRSASSDRGYRRRGERRRRSRSPHHSTRPFVPQHRKPFKDNRPNKTLTYKETLRQKLLEAQKQAAEGTLELSNIDSADLMTLNEKPSSLPLKTIYPLMSLQTGPADKVTPQQALIQTMAAMHQKAQQITGVAVPKYYNPAAVNPLKFAEQVKKRKLLWSKKEDSVEAPPVPVPAAPVETVPCSSAAAANMAAGTSAVKQWQDTAFIQDDDGKVAAKFRKLMGIKKGEAASKLEVEDKNPEAQEQIRKQQMMFEQLDREYEFARMTTHTHRGVGLGFSSQGFPEQK